MINGELWQSIAHHISVSLSEKFRPDFQQPVPGGCINRSYCIGNDRRRFFVKLNSQDRLGFFQREAEGLALIRETSAVRVPDTVCMGTCNADSYLVLEYLEMSTADIKGQRNLGRQLALMHRSVADRFGGDQDNYIGASPQLNSWYTAWPEFWRTQRLGFQIGLLQQNGYRGSLIEGGYRIAEKLLDLFSEYRPEASLLHGDLWAGNFATLADSTPILFDPACYYGDREADLAMTELFGGFGTDFYQCYRDAWPLDPGYRVRKKLYKLYHVHNHLNLFGGGYESQAQALTAQLLSEMG